MNIMIFASTPISHIYPLKPLIDELIAKGNNVYCLSTSDRKELIESYKAKFIPYPFDFERNALINLNLSDKMFELEYLWERKRYLEAMEEFLKYDLRSVNQATKESLQQIENLIIKYDIDLIFRDAVEKHAYIVAKKLKIKCIGYITHNLYSRSFFERNPEYYYRIFLNCKNYPEIQDEFFKNYRKYIENLTAKETVADTQETMKVLHQFDPAEEFNLIFSTEKLQPDYFDKDGIYEIIYPLCTRFEIEKNIPKGLEKFIDDSNKYGKKIVYIATGSMMSDNQNYYINFADFLIKNNLRVIISLSYNINIVKEKLIDKGLIDDVYIDTFIPQKYVLSKSALFLTSGGQNSILEAMFYKVPMLINPITSEQRMNAVWLEEINVARSSYNIRNKHITIGHMIMELLNDLNIHKRIENISNDLRNHQNNFDKMWSYIHEKN